MPSSLTSDKTLVPNPLQTPPKLTEPLPCPRCNSTNTKFCYYNNYNLSQPRHFCKGCRRYWTQGGTLRNIPVGGGTRKSSKRSRSSNTTNSPTSSSTNSSISTLTHEPEPLPQPVTANASQVSPLVKVENGDHNGLSLSEKNEGFGAMVSSQGQVFFDPYVYGPGFGLGLCEMGIGFGGRGGVWSYPGLSYIGGGVEGLGSGSSVCNTWQFNDVGSSGGEGFSVHGESDGFAWPGLAISAPGKSSK